MKADRYVEIDRGKTLAEEPALGHNRWHPDLTPAARVAPGEVVGIETRDAFDGQITAASDAAAVGACNLGLVHPHPGQGKARFAVAAAKRRQHGQGLRQIQGHRPRLRHAVQ